MKINLEGLVIIAGNYGSGKTEVTLNLAANQKRAGLDVCVADLDLVNPYFRTREARKKLADIGISVVLPPEKYLNADLPILSPAISGLIRNPRQLTLLDIGGDDVGATILATLAEALRGLRVDMLLVVNPYRPFTNTIEACLKMRKEIESASNLSISGIIGNANLIDETTPADISDGYQFVKSLSKESGLPLEFITCTANLYSAVDPNCFSCPVLPIHRQLVPPWKKAQAL